MNFNLISPNGNGYDFTTRFREDVEIKPNSQVYLNFSALSQRVGVELDTDQTITLFSNQLLPVYNPDTLDLNLLNETITIKKGRYNLNEFRDLISNGLNSLVSLGDITKTKNQLAIYRSENTDLNPNDKPGDDFISIGYKTNASRISLEDELSLDTTNILNFGVSATDPDDIYVKTDATTIDYSAYGLSQKKYFFYNLSKENEDNGEQDALFLCSQKLSDFSSGEKCGFGLYSTEYMSLYSHGGNIINGGNFYLSNGVPKCFLWCEITHTHFVVYVAEDTSGNLINDWTDINTDIGNMRGVFRIPLFGFLNYDDTQFFSIKTYYDVSTDLLDKDNRKLYFSIIDVNSGDIVFDSKTMGNYYFPYAFLDNGTVAGNADRANSSIPFKFLLSSNTQNLGFKSILFNTFNETKYNSTDTKPNSIIQNYELKFSSGLAEYLNVLPDEYINPLQPNIFDTVFYWLGSKDNWGMFVLLSNLNLDYINSNYTVYLEELPTNNYKNTETSQNGGYSQNIIANIPVPFSNLVSNTNKDTQVITGLYQPNFQIISNMKNQSIRSNHFRVIIKRMEDDKPATELLRSIINFTVLEKQ